MTTLNLALIAMLIGSNMMPSGVRDAASHIKYPAAQIEMVSRQEIEAAVVNKDDTARASSINADRTPEGCADEAFERVYEQVNRLLDQIPERCNEQFQLQ